MTTTKEKAIREFYFDGKDKSEIIKNILTRPNWIQTPEKLNCDNMIFIGSVSESDFINGIAELYLFWDKETILYIKFYNGHNLQQVRAIRTDLGNCLIGKLLNKN